ncbi:hypothetical protein [Microbacterium sp. YY-01]|uniref:hypothetical protein n=1 Tax=Microbacterium sp. YY-01 TaxID=3421634 RepID=UPI003D179B09
MPRLARRTEHLHTPPTLIEDERGDVPGWVLVTLMTAALVMVVWGLAGPALTRLFDQALTSVSGIG